MRDRVQDFITRRSHHDGRLLEEYVSYLNYEDTNVQAAMLVANSLTSIGSGNEFILNNGNWVKKAENWTKFHIIASFAMVWRNEWNSCVETVVRSTRHSEGSPELLDK